MPDFYLSSVDGSDGSNGTTWALAKATQTGVFAVMSAGDTCFMDDAHNESTAAAITLTSPGTAAAPCRVLCVTRGADIEPPTALATTGIVATGVGANRIFFEGFCYAYGVSFKGGVGSSSDCSLRWTAGFPLWWRYEQCGLETASTATASDFWVGGGGSGEDDGLVELIETDVSFGHINNEFRMGGMHLVWRGGTLTGNQTLLFRPNAMPLRLEVTGVDLSPMVSGDSLVSLTEAESGFGVFQNCKLGAAVALTTGTPAGQGGVNVEAVNCDSADTNYRFYKETYSGIATQETVIVRRGGGNDGSTSLARKLVTNANSDPNFPLTVELPAVWNETIGKSISVVVEVITDNVTLLDTEAWLQCEYLGTSGFPLSLFADDRAAGDVAHLGTGTAQTTSIADWVTAGLTTPTKQKFTVTLTAVKAGWIYPVVHLAKASTTMYSDFKVDVT